MKLFMIITACDNWVLFQYFMSLHTCEFGLYKLFSKTVFYSKTGECEDEYRALYILTKSSTQACLFAVNYGFILQICVCVDLILMLKKPFTPKESRMPYYHAAAFLDSAFISTVYTYFLDEKTLFHIAEGFACGGIVLNWVLNAISLSYGFHKLCKPGISYNVRKQIMARHVVTIVFF